jgi:hypothetical protein
MLGIEFPGEEVRKMGQIQVFIQAEGKTKKGDVVPPKAVAIPDKKAVLSGETLTWHIHCDNPAVEKVKIEFDPPRVEGDDAIFRVIPKKPHTLVKELHNGDKASTRTCIITAHMPTPSDSKVRTDKYRIVGLDKNGAELENTELDPEIIIADPGP